MNIATWLCYAVGYVFITSGIMKLVMPNLFNFAGLGLPSPETTLFLLAIVEIGCGALIAGGMYVKKASIPLLIIMAGAIFYHKLPILIEQGILSFAFNARLDIVMIILLLLLFKHVPGKKL